MWQPNVASDVEPDCSCTRLVYNTGADNTYTLLLGVWYAAGFVGETVKCLNQRQLTWYAEWRCREFVKWRKRITFTEERKREVDTLRKKVVLESWVCCERCQDGPLMLKSYPLCFHLFLSTSFSTSPQTFTLALLSTGPGDQCVKVFGNRGWPMPQSMSQFTPSRPVHLLFFIPQPSASSSLSDKQAECEDPLTEEPLSERELMK